ncbi:MAG: arsenite methyltransferase [Bacteroidales bacterium]
MKIKKKNIKSIVRSKYDQIAQQSKENNKNSCCGGTDCCSDMDYSVFSDDYSNLQGYNEDADLGLGCGIPTDFANLQKGDIVLDLGSGAGNDCFVAHSFVGEEGFVYGIDFSDEMLNKARGNAQKLGIKNIKFIKGDIESMPFDNDIMDKVLSNCVLNLVPHKKKAFAEIYRTLKPAGSFCISDVVTIGQLPSPILKSAEMYAGCVAGASSKDEYLNIIQQTGFSDIQIHKEKEIVIPSEVLSKYLSEKDIEAFRTSQNGIYSITVNAKKKNYE